MKMNRKALVSILVFIMASGMAGALSAAENVDFSHGAERTIGDHTFLHSRFVVDPFVSTAFSNFVGGASAPTYRRDFFDLNGDLLFTLEGSVVFATLGMNYQQCLGKNWAVGVGGSGLIRSGSSALSFIDDGANVNTGIDAWTKRLLSRGDKSQLTAGLSWHYSTVTYYTPRDFAEHLINGGSLATAPFMITGKGWDLQADFFWAYAFNSMYAIRATGSFGIVEKYGDSGLFLGKNQVGVLGEADFSPRHDFPLGITLGYIQSFPIDRLQSGPNGWVLGFWFTGRQDLIIGLESGWMSIQLTDDGDIVDGIFSSINIKYFF